MFLDADSDIYRATLPAADATMTPESWRKPKGNQNKESAASPGLPALT